jgi:hypothetical protein
MSRGQKVGATQQVSLFAGQGHRQFTMRPTKGVTLGEIEGQAIPKPLQRFLLGRQ